jgi:FkbM family methyltransferase
MVTLARKVFFHPLVKGLLSPFVRLLYYPSVNRSLRPFIRPLSHLLGDVMLAIPVIGRMEFTFLNKKPFYIESDGYDTITNGLYWCGMGSYESETLPYFLKIVSRSRKIFDIGANTGLYAILAAKEITTEMVYAFEPTPRIFGYLKRNAEVNSLNNIKLELSALSNYDGEIELYIPSGMIPTSSSTLKGFRKASEILKVPSIRLDTYCKKRDIKDIDLLKIDTEGTEHLVIEGGIETIKRDQPIIICEVLEGFTERFIHKLLDPIGYEYYWLSDKGPIKQETIVGHGDKSHNYLFSTQRRIETLHELEIL